MDRLRRHSQLVLLFAAVLVLLIVGALVLSLVATPGSIHAGDGPPAAQASAKPSAAGLLRMDTEASSAEKAVQRAWRNARDSGVYDFQTEITQVTHPGPALANVGRSSVEETLSLSGHTDLPAQNLEIRLWDESSGQGPEDAFQMRMQGERAYGRCPACDDWEEIDDFRGALLPGSDLMVYLAGAREIAEQETESLLGMRVTRYTFEVDGPAFGEHMRKQIEDYLRERGELPGVITLDLARQYTDMVGQGEIWITDDGLPLRLQVRLEFPTGPNGDWIEAQIRNDFSHYDMQWLQAARLVDDPGEWVTAQLGRAARYADAWRQTGRQALVLIVAAAMLVLLFRYGRMRRVYATVAVAMVVIMVVTPLLQSQQVVAFYDRQAAKAAEQEERQQQQEAAQEYQDLLSNADWDPHQDPRTRSTQEIGEKARQDAAGEAPVATRPLAQPPAETPAGAPSVGEVPLPSLYHLLQNGDNGNDPDPEGDEDGDTLTWAMEQFLGTNPSSDDTDGDGITDDVEVEGFEYNGQHWYLDPRTPDTNGDGLIDSLECPESWRVDPTTGLSPQGVCQDSDGDGTPDVFDRDNDGDGVSDRVDMAPGDAMGMDSPFTSANPFYLTVDNLATDIPAFVDIQLRPTEAEHLSYMYNVLDWPTGDTEGQIQRVLDTTWRDQSAGGPESDTYGDMRLIPLLEITIPHLDGHYGNLPVLPGAPEIDATQPITTWLDTSKLEPYGIQVNYKDGTGDLLAYVPLKLVYDETGGGKAAFAGRMVYQPSLANWGPAQEVRVVWLVQAVVDVCDLDSFTPSEEAGEDSELYAEEQDAFCGDPANRIELVQVVHSYGEEWTLTGLAVREDHGMDLAVVLEDPTTDADVNEDHNLWALANGLGKSFMAGRDADGDGERDIDIAEIQHRFDNQTNTSIPAEDERLWGLDKDAFRVVTYNYPTQDYVAHIPMTVTLEVLDTYFMSGSTPLSETPLLLFAREERYRSAALGGGADVVVQIDEGRGLRFTMGDDTVPNYTTAYMQWQTYRRVEGAWEPYALEEYYDPLYLELKDLLQDQEFGPEELGLEDTVALAVYFYISLQQGASGLVQGASIPVDNPYAEPDSSLTLWYFWISYYKDLYKTIAGEIAGPIIEFMQQIWGMTSPDKLSFYGLLYQVEPGNLGRIKYTAAETWRSLTTSQIAFAAGAVIGGAVICMGLGVLANFFEITPLVHIQNFIGVVFATMNMVGMLRSFVRLVKEGMHWGKPATILAAEFSAAWKEAEGVTKAAVVGLILEVTMQWGGFILNWALSGVAVASLAFTQMLAEVIAQTIASIILFAIACIPVVGEVIMAIMGLIDAVIWFICGFLPEDAAESEAAGYICRAVSGLVATFVGWIIYSQTILVDFDDTERLDIYNVDQRFVDPLKGMATGNSLAYSAAMTNTITMVDVPIDWKAAAYWWQYNMDTFRSSTFDYAFALEEPEDDADKFHKTAGLARDQMNDVWVETADKTLQMTDTVDIDGVPLPGPGLDRPIELYLAEGFAVPAQECWSVPVPTPWGFVLVPVCYIRSFKDTSYIDMGQSFLFDVFPATLSEFYDLARVDSNAGNDGGFRLAWDARFPRLKDADGDGLLNKADGGADPNDSLWDADLDGLGDLYELQHGADPINADTDGDQLNDWDEIRLGTDPRRADTDGDGLLDGQEVFHQLETGAWVGGWEIVYGYDAGGSPLRTWVSSDPLSIDGDQDGWTDFQERTFGYHPGAPNASNQLTFESELKELVASGVYTYTDGYVAPGDTLYFDSQVTNELMGRQAQGLLSAEASSGLDPDLLPVTFALQPLETEAIAGEIAVRSDAATAQSTVDQVAGALITNPREESGYAVASLHLDEATGATTFADSSGAPLHDGTCSGDACPQAEVEGAYGYAARFDGADDSLPLGTFQVEGQITLAAWVKPEALDGLRNIIAHGYGGDPTTEVSLRIREGRYEVGSLDSTGPHRVSYTIPSQDVNAWVHLVGVYDGAAWRLYRNGEQVAMTYDATGAPALDAPWAIGAKGDGSQGFFQGTIDEVAIYETGFSPVQVQELYRRPVLHLALDEAEGALVFADSSGSDNVARATSGTTQPSAGHQGISQQAVRFGGNDKLVLDANPSLALNNPAFTLAAWAKPINSGDSAKNDYAQGLIGMDAGEAEAYPSLDIVGRKLRAGFSAYVDGSYRWYEYQTQNDLVTRGAWNHVVVTFDGVRLYFYVNGKLGESGIPQEPGTANTYPTNAPLYAADTVTIGRTNDGDVYLDRLEMTDNPETYRDPVQLDWNGHRAAGGDDNKWDSGETWTIDQTLSFDTGAALGIGSDYHRDLCGIYIFSIDAPPPSDNEVDIITVETKNWTGAYDGFEGTLYTRYYNHAIPFRGYLDDVRIYKRPLVATDLVNEVEDLYHAATIAMRLRLDEPPGATRFADWTGQHPGSAPAGGATQPTAGIGGRVNQAVRFDGVDDRISVDLPLTPEYTLGAWVRFLGDDWSGGPHTILEFGDDAPWLGVNTSGELALNGSGGGVSGGSVPVGEWAHVAFTWNATQGQLYLNGVAVGSALTAAPTLSDTLGIGHGIGQGAWLGDIDDVIAYKRALPADEIASLYGSAPQLMLHLEEDLLDSSGNGYDATCAEGQCPAQDIKGRIGRAVTFDGVDDYLQLPDANTLGLPGEDWTISTWFKADALATSGTHALVAQGPPTGSNLFLGIVDGKPTLHAYGLDLTGETRLQPNTWYHIAWNVDLPEDGSGTAMGGILLNGSVVTQTQFSTVSGGGSVPVYVGGTPGGYGFDGVVDEVTVYRRPLSTRDLREVYAYQMAWVEERVRTPIVIDADEPQSTLLSDASIIPLRDTVMAISAGDPTSRVDAVAWRINGGAWSECPKCLDSGTSWCPTFDPSAEGRYIVETRATDIVGNVQSTPSSYTIYVDDQAPEAVRTMSSEDVLPAPRHESLRSVRYVELTGQALDPLISGQYAGSGVARVEVELLDANGFSAGRGKQSATVQATGAPGTVNWSLRYLFDEADPTGTYTMRVTVEDRVGKVATTDLMTIQVDARPPLVAQAHPDVQVEAQGSLTQTATLITGNVVDDEDAAGNGVVSGGVGGVEIAFVPAENGSVFSEAAPELVLPFDGNWLADGSAFRDATDQASAMVTTHDGLNHAVTGQVGSYALHLDANDSVTVDRAIGLAGSSFTVEFWARSDADGVLLRHGGDGSGKALLVGLADNDQFIFSFDDSCASPLLLSQLNASSVSEPESSSLQSGGLQTADEPELQATLMQVSAGEWAHYAFVYDAEAGDRFIYWRRANSDVWNGLQFSQGSATPYQGTGPITLGAGSLPGGCDPFRGDVDNLIVHTRALSLDELKATDSGWHTVGAVTLDGDGKAGTWQYPVPAGLEGLYEIRLRGRDHAGNVSSSDAGSPVWRGSIDTLAPRFAAQREHLGEGSASKTRFSGYAEDFNLSESDFRCPCPPELVAREYFEAPWYTEVATDSVPHLYRLSYTCEVPGYDYRVTFFRATDIYSHTVEDIEGGLRPMGSLTISDTAKALDMVGTTGYLAMGTQGFALVDASDPREPVLAAGPSISGTQTAVDVRDVAADGAYAYLADPGAGVRVFDVTQMEETTPYYPDSVLGGDNLGDVQGFGKPAISDDGRFVAFASKSIYLVEGETQVIADVFVKDMLTRKVERVSVAVDGGQANAASNWPDISGDGRYVAFTSNATNLVSGVTNPYPGGAYVRDRQTGSTYWASCNTDGSYLFGVVYYPSISDDGSRVAFALETVPVGARAYVKDIPTGELRLVSVNQYGTSANREIMRPAISGNGRYVVFETQATNLTSPYQTDDYYDIFVRDLQENTTMCVSVDANGQPLGGDSTAPSISADGSRIAFVYANNAYMVSNPPQGDPILLSATPVLWDRLSISPSGEGVAFASARDIFVVDFSPVTHTVRIPVNEYSAANAPALSGDLRRVAFWTSTGLEAWDGNGYWDVYLYDRDVGRDGVYDEEGDTRYEIVSVSAPAAEVVSRSGDTLCVGTTGDASRLELVDVTTPTDPQELGSTLVAPGLRDVVYDGNGTGGPIGPVAYVIAHTGGAGDGFYIYPMSTFPFQAEVVAWDTRPGKIFSRVVVKDGYAYVAGKDDNTGATLLIYEVTYSAGRLTPAGTYSTPFNGQAIAVDGGYAYLGAGDTLYVLDVSRPSTPVKVGSMQLGASIQDLYASNGYIYALTDKFEVLRLGGGTEYPATVILSPAHGTVYDTASPTVPISGWAYAEHGSLASLTVTINGTQHGDTLTWSAGEESATWTAADWTPAADGAYRIEAVSTDSTGGALHDAITITLDTAAPTISLPTTVFTSTHYDPGAGQVDLTGRTNDAAGAGWLTGTVTYNRGALLTLIEGDDGPASADGTWTGYLYVDADAPPDGSQGQKLLQATVTDRAGRTATVQQIVLIDVVRPVTVTLGLMMDSQPLQPGAAIYQDAADLDLTWGASSDAMGLAGYTVTWTDGQGQVLQQHDVAPDATLSDRLGVTGPARVMAQLTIRDTNGNEQVQSVGPIYVDGPTTPDYVTLLGDDPPYHGWMESGTTLIGTDRRINDNAPKQAALWEEQKLYATWDGGGLRLAWTGADWNTDGDLLILLDTIAGQGTAQVPDLYGGAGSTVYLPETTATAMAADYLVWVRDANLAHLYTWDEQSQSWSGGDLVTALGAEQFRFFGGLNGGHTDLYLPFDEIGISDPASAVVEMVALATDEGALSTWSTMPPENPVSSPKVNEYGELVPDGADFGLLQSYRWEGLVDGVAPNGSSTVVRQGMSAAALQGVGVAGTRARYLDVDLTLRVTTDPAGSVYGYLRDGLFWMWDALFAGDRPAELSESFDFMDPEYPALGDGQEVTYTFQATNRGRDAAQSVYAQLAAHYALRLLDEGGNPVDSLTVPLGDVGPGETVKVVVSGVVGLAHARDAAYTSCLSAHADDPLYCDRYLRWAQLGIRFYDADHGEDGQPLDWVWVDHAVDPQAPQFYGLQSPRYLVSPTGATLSGYAYDNSAVDRVELDIDGTTATAASEDGRWSYPWTLSGAQDGDEVHIAVRAVDEFGQAGAWTAARTLVVDGIPPTVSLDPLVLQNVAGRTLQSDPAALSGTLSDNRGAGGVEVCIDGRCEKAETRLVRGETRSYEDASTQSIGGSSNAVQVTFSVGESFALGDISLGLSIDHPYRDDLVATLTSPAGTTVRVLSGRRTLLDTYAHYDRLLADAAPGDLFSWQGDDDPAEPAFDGISRPYAPLGAFLGEEAYGTWTLRIWDVDTAQHAGTYQQARLILTPQDVEPRSGTWRYTMPASLGVQDGERTIEIYAWDSVGNRTVAPVVLTYRLDRTAPELAITEAVDAIVSMDPTPVLTGTVSDAGTIAALYAVVEGPAGGKVQAPITWWQDGAWGYSLQPEGEGIYKLWINAEDEAGNGRRLGPVEVSVTAPAPPPEPQVLVWLDADAETFCPGSPVGYYFRVTNIGDQVLTNLTVSDTVPEGACCPVDISESGAVSEDGSSIAWQVAELAVGETFMARVTLTTPGDVPDEGEFVNAFSYSAAELAEAGEASLGVVADVGVCSDTTTTVSTPARVVLLGKEVTFSATVDPVPPAVGTPDGAVTFYDGEVVLAENVALENGMAQVTTSDLAAGPHAISAAYNGVPPWVGSASSPVDCLIAAPALTLDKVTNGADGQTILTDSPVNWTYTVKNTGNVPLSNVTVTDNMGVVPAYDSGDTNADGKLDLSETWIYEAGGTAVAGDYSNTGTASASFTDGLGNTSTTTNEDTSAYFGANPQIAVAKVTVSGAAEGDGLTVLAGEAIKWRYTVTNIGNVPLSGVSVTDSDSAVTPAYVSGDTIGDGVLDQIETWIYEADGTAVAGSYGNTGTAAGSYAYGADQSSTATAEDASAYLGAAPGFTVSKACQAEPVPQEGPALFIVTFENTGNVALSITADDGVGTFDLAVGEKQSFEVGVDGPFSGQPSVENTVTASASYTDDAGHKWSSGEQSANVSCRVGSRANLLKWTQGIVDPLTSWTFSLWAGPDGFGSSEALATSNSGGDQDGVLDFGNANLDRLQAYTLCEEQVNAGWTSFWQVDSDGDGDIDIDDAILIPYNPNKSDNPPADLGNRCVDLGAGTGVDLLSDGSTLLFMVNNTYPGGDPRSSGYWKNWNRCTGGGQQYAADANGGYMDGFWLLDDVLNPSVGGGITWDDIEEDSFTFPIELCAVAVDLLDKRDVGDPELVADGPKMSSDGAYALASQLLVAQLNFGAGAKTCDAAFDAALAGEQLLDKYDFDGSGEFLPSDSKDKKIKADYALALEIAATLDQYNNGELCTGPAVAFLTPLDGDTLVGEQTLQVRIIDTVPTTQVEFYVDGLPIRVDSTASDGWSILWNSASVEDGSHTLSATATNSLGETGSANVVVNVDNIVDPPVVTITSPEDGATVSSASVSISAEASSTSGVTQVEFFVDDNPIGADSDGSDGWSIPWDSTSVGDGSHTLSATATASDGQTASHSIGVTVHNEEGPTIVVADLSGSSVWTRPNAIWQATVTVTIDPALAGAVVTGAWRDDTTGTCTTGTDGTCSIALDNISKKTGSVTFTVIDITLAGYVFEPSGPSTVDVPKPQ